ncbi:MAG: exodeoxyribonuclease V subunit gamma [Myxococcales bacterium]|nr:exodeoxyribonuclease V subunit gamma [Myxococcales bacterium]
MPGLRVYRSNRIEVLAEILGELLRSAPPADPFEPVEVVVAHPGMERWLRHRLAEQLGLCANVLFPFPAARIQRLLDQVLQEPQAAPAGAGGARPDLWRPQSLRWALLEVLPGLVEQPGFEAVAGYLDDWHGPAGPKLLGLCRQLADVFDQYAAYRPELALAFSDGQRPAPAQAGEHLGWQAALWHAIQQHHPQHLHRASRLLQAERLLRSGAPCADLEAPLRLFGVNTMPPSWLSLLSAAATRIDVELFLLTPSHVYWAELIAPRLSRSARWLQLGRDEVDTTLDPDGELALHPLLISLGRLTRDFQIVLEAQSDGYQDSPAFFDVERAFADARSSVPALGRLQSDLLAARLPPPPGHRLEPGDDSIQFHRCHGPTRQVEVLRELLLGLLADDPELEARDILIMTPDLERYAPLCDAVFSQGRFERSLQGGRPQAGPDAWGSLGAPRIALSISDLGARQQNPVADALLHALELIDGRFEASAVLDLLALEPVAARFELDRDDLSVLRGWIADSGIRWGRDGAHRAHFEQPDDEQSTWRFGLRRLMLGVVQADDGRLLSGLDAAGRPTQVRAFDAIEGTGSERVGRLASFCNMLFALAEQLQAPRPMDEWAQALLKLLEALTRIEDVHAWHQRAVREAIAALVSETELAGCARTLSLPALRLALADAIEAPSAGSREQSGALTLCAMQPMRSVPYRVICLLGMDEDALPRARRGHGFDAIERAPRLGDRDLRDEDRQLVLEAILAARQRLLVLYSGRDPHDGELRPPCVPIGELRDCIDDSFCTAADDTRGPSEALSFDHPLQAFSPSAFTPRHGDPRHPETPRPFSFDRSLRAGAEAIARPGEQALRPPFFTMAVAAPDAAVDDRTGSTIELEDLIAFFREPTAHLMRRHMRIDLRDYERELEDREAIGLDALARWSLRKAIVEARLRGQPAEAAIAEVTAEGRLPLGYAGRSLAAREAAVAEDMLHKAGLIDAAGAPRARAPARPFELDVGGVCLRGSLEILQREVLLQLQFGSSESHRNTVGAWIALLAASQSDAATTRAAVVYGGFVGGAPKTTLIGFETPPDAHAQLEALVAIYRRGCRQPIPLFPNASYAFAKKLSKLEVIAEDAFEPGARLDPELQQALAVALGDAEQAFEAAYGPQDRAGDLDEPHIARVFSGQSPLRRPGSDDVDPDFARLSLQLWRAAWACRRTTSVVKHWLVEQEP